MEPSPQPEPHPPRITRAAPVEPPAVASAAVPVTIAVAATALIVGLFPALGALLIDRADALAAGEWWRLFSGHLVHGSGAHLGWNLLLFLPLAALRERRVGSSSFLAELTLLAAAVATGVRLCHDGWATYEGLSGIAYGLLLLELWPARHGVAEPWALALLAFVVSKTGLEMAVGGWVTSAAALERQMGIVLLPGSHLAGLVAASLLVWRPGAAVPTVPTIASAPAPAPWQSDAPPVPAPIVCRFRR